MSYEYRPWRQNYYVHLLLLGLLSLSAAGFVCSALIPAKFAVIPQAVSVALLLPFIQLVARYLVPQYLYRVRVPEDGGLDLEIFCYRGGHKMQLVCRIALCEITAATPIGPENRRPPKGLKRYAYCMDIFPQKALVLSVKNADGECEVLLTPDEKMSALLTPGALREPFTPIEDSTNTPANGGN